MLLTSQQLLTLVFINYCTWENHDYGLGFII
jgi:hypothetical protein